MTTKNRVSGQPCSFGCGHRLPTVKIQWRLGVLGVPR